MFSITTQAPLLRNHRSFNLFNLGICKGTKPFEFSHKEAAHMVSHLEARSRYEKMLASSATAAICASADHLIISWNSAAEKLFGHSAQYAIGKPLSIIIPHAKRSEHCIGFDRAQNHHQ